METNIRLFIALKVPEKVKVKAEELLNYISSLQIEPISFEATEFVLKQSVLTKSGPVYIDIERYELSPMQLHK